MSEAVSMNDSVTGPGPAPDLAPPSPLPGDAKIERRTLPPRAETYWRVGALLFWVPAIAALVVGAVLLPWPVTPLRWLVVALVAAYVVGIELAVGPRIRRRVFWYALSADEIEVQQGWILRTRTVVPMNRVQHLETNRGPLADRFTLAHVHVHTAAGTVKMEALDRDEADDLRARIGALAQLADDV